MNRNYKNKVWEVVKVDTAIYTPKLIIRCSNGWNLCEMIGHRDMDKIKADAKLISSAPDMLNALIEISNAIAVNVSKGVLQEMTMEAIKNSRL